MFFAHFYFNCAITNRLLIFSPQTVESNAKNEKILSHILFAKMQLLYLLMICILAK